MSNGNVTLEKRSEAEASVQDLQTKIAELEKQLDVKNKKEASLAREQAGGFNALTAQGSANSIIKELVEQVLGKQFKWSLLGFGKHQFVEIYVPDNLADPSSSYEANLVQKTEAWKHPTTGQVFNRPMFDENGAPIMVDGRPRFRKPHPLAGQPQGDVRTIRVQDEDQLRAALDRLKLNIIQRFKGENKNLPEFI